MCKDLQSEGKFMGVNEIGSCRVDIKSKATVQNCGSYIGTGDGCPMHVSMKYLCGPRPCIVDRGVRATLRRGHSYMKILRDRGEPNRRDTLTQW